MIHNQFLEYILLRMMVGRTGWLQMKVGRTEVLQMKVGRTEVLQMKVGRMGEQQMKVGRMEGQQMKVGRMVILVDQYTHQTLRSRQVHIVHTDLNLVGLYQHMGLVLQMMEGRMEGRMVVLQMMEGRTVELVLG